MSRMAPSDRSALLAEIQTLKSQVAILDAQRARLGRMAEMMNALASFSVQINTLDAGQIKDLAVSRIPALVRAKGAALFASDGRAGILLLERHSDPSFLKGARPFLPFEDSLLERAVSSKDVLVVSNLEAFASVLGGEFRLSPALKPIERCCILAPLRASDALVGVLVLMDKEDGGEMDVLNDVPPVQQASQLLASAIRNVDLYEQVMAQSKTDSLTGLMNRRALWELLAQEIWRARRYGNALTAMLIDLDRFKEINDTHGHKEGDAVLCGAAEVLLAQVRTADRVARHGGDEFFVLLPETDLKGAKVVGERLLERIRAWTSPAGAKPTFSIGVAALSGAMTAAELTAAADGALYQAKAAGRNTLAMAEPPQDPPAAP